MDATTKVATLNHLKPKKYNKLFGFVIGLVLSVLLLAAVSTAYLSGIFVSASNDAPQELIVRNITSKSAQLVWTTGVENIGYIEYGTNPSALTLIAPEVTPTRNHSLQLTLLKPNTTYYFRLRVGDKVFDNAGVPWTFATRPEEDAEHALQQGGQNEILEEPKTSPTPTQVEPTTTISTPEDPILPTKSAMTGSCSATNCDMIREMLGKECTTSDLVANKCL